MTHDETLALMAVMDEIRRQIGLRYVADEAADDAGVELTRVD
jgi:hypothetical protein